MHDASTELSPTIVTCRCCGRTVTKWVAVLWQHEHDLHGEEIEVTDGSAIATLCGYCADQVETAVQLAVAGAINSAKAA